MKSIENHHSLLTSERLRDMNIDLSEYDVKIAN